MLARHEYLLFSEALRNPSGQLTWRMLLVDAVRKNCIAASEELEEGSVNRAELWALVRGLEALDGPANVRLFTNSQYLRRGLSRQLPQWRAERWHWEHFGRRVPIRDSDLWQRVDRALEFHNVEAQAWGEQNKTSEYALAVDDQAPCQPTEPRRKFIKHRISRPAPHRRTRDRFANPPRQPNHRLGDVWEPIGQSALLATG